VSRSIVDEISRALEQINKDLDDAMLRSKEVESTSDVIEPVQVVPLINNRVDDHDENAIDNSSSHSGGDDDDMHSSHVALDVSHRLRAHPPTSFSSSMSTSRDPNLTCKSSNRSSCWMLARKHFTAPTASPNRNATLPHIFSNRARNRCDTSSAT